MLALLSLVLCAIVLPNAVDADFCDYVLAKNCNTQQDNGPVCGTDGITYQNSCFYAKTYCINKNIHQAHLGPCTAASTTSTPTTTPTTTPTPTTTTTTTTTTTVPTTTPTPVNGALIALDIFCLDIAYIDCGTTGPRVCDTDGNSYENLCEFDKSRCTHRDIHSTGKACP